MIGNGGITVIKNFLIKMFLSSLFLAAFSFKYVDTTIGEKLYEHPLESAWKTTGVPLEIITTEAWLKLNDEWLTQYELKQLASQIQNKLKLKLTTNINSGEQDNYTYVSFEGLREDNTLVTITIQSNHSDNYYETQMGVYTSSRFSGHLRRYLRDLKNFLSVLGEEIHLSILLEGKCEGKISAAVFKEMSGRILHSLNGEIVERKDEAEGSTIKGFTRLLDERDINVIGTKPVNVEICSLYDRERDVTELTLASPGDGR